jgi:hypothetical protein
MNVYMPEPYKIKVVYKNEQPSAEIGAIISRAVDIITDIISETHGNRGDRDCDMVVNITLETMPDDILGSSGISHYAENLTISPDFPIEQEITLNKTRIESTLLQVGSFNGDNTSKKLLAVMIHEILHGLGISSISGYDVGWVIFLNNGRTWYVGKNGDQVGSRAIQEYRNILNNPAIKRIPVENNFGAGTAYSHWEEGKKAGFNKEYRFWDGVYHPSLPNEIMTGFSGNEYFTGLTAGALEDYGYKINWDSSYIVAYPENLIEALPAGYTPPEEEVQQEIAAETGPFVDNSESVPVPKGPLGGIIAKGFSCFPNHAYVTLKNQNQEEKCMMKDLVIGDVIQTGPETWSEVFGFTHADTSSFNTFLKIETVNHASITLTPGHYLYVNDSLKLARDVEIGDCLNKTDKVVNIQTTVCQGLINPHTLDGKIMVNGIEASNYTDFLAAAVAHKLMSPWRLAYQVGKTINSFKDLDQPIKA